MKKFKRRTKNEKKKKLEHFCASEWNAMCGIVKWTNVWNLEKKRRKKELKEARRSLSRARGYNGPISDVFLLILFASLLCQSCSQLIEYIFWLIRYGTLGRPSNLTLRTRDRQRVFRNRIAALALARSSLLLLSPRATDFSNTQCVVGSSFVSVAAANRQ